MNWSIWSTFSNFSKFLSKTCRTAETPPFCRIFYKKYTFNFWNLPLASVPLYGGDWWRYLICNPALRAHQRKYFIVLVIKLPISPSTAVRWHWTALVAAPQWPERGATQGETAADNEHIDPGRHRTSTTCSLDHRASWQRPGPTGVSSRSALVFNVPYW